MYIYKFKEEKSLLNDHNFLSWHQFELQKQSAGKKAVLQPIKFQTNFFFEIDFLQSLLKSLTLIIQGSNIIKLSQMSKLQHGMEL